MRSADKAMGNRTGNDQILDADWMDILRRRARILHLLDAAERAGITPLGSARIHGFAYLADVLSPVWGLLPFDGKILKVEGGPHYPELQYELDRLVVMGLVEIRSLSYTALNNGARLNAEYSLRFESSHLLPILGALGARSDAQPFDDRDRVIHSFLVELAGALATVPDEEIKVAATVDATYADQRIDAFNIIDFGDWSANPKLANLSQRTTERFGEFLPTGAVLSSGERIYLYAQYLSRRIHAG